MDGAGFIGILAQVCPTTTGRQFPQAASEYSKLAGLLAGFAFTALVFILRERVSGRFAQAVEVLVFAFFGLILTSANYAVITGEEAQYAGGRAVSEGVFAGGAFTVSGILLLYSIILLLDAVEKSGEKARADAVEDEGDFGRVKRHLSAITATFVAFLLILMVAPGASIYADVADRPVVEVVGWIVAIGQLLLSTVIGVAYVTLHRRRRRPAMPDWTGTSRFGLVSVGFVLVSTLACQWAGQISPCDQVHWLVIAAAVAIHGLIMGYASLVIAGPWLRLRRSEAT